MATLALAIFLYSVLTFHLSMCYHIPPEFDLYADNHNSMSNTSNHMMDYRKPIKSPTKSQDNVELVFLFESKRESVG